MELQTFVQLDPIDVDFDRLSGEATCPLCQKKMYFFNQQVPTCEYCGQPATQQCGGCKLVHYCSRAHQKLAWREGHKFKCCAFKIDYKEGFGRCLVATRDIKQGEMILKEKPAVIGPRMSTTPVCLGCNKKLQPINYDGIKLDYFKCSACRWPMCGPECEKINIHKPECDLMKKRNYKSAITFDGVEKNEPAYCVIAPLRVLLMKNTNPIQYENVINLESHLEERMNTPLYMTLRANLITFIVQVLGLSEFDQETIMKVTSIFDTNAFDVRIKNESRFRGIYVTASMMAHDCRPNTKHVFVGDENYLALIATSPIAKGDLITITYTQTLWGTLERRAHLKIAKCFECECARCKDPTELGIYVGSIFCSVCNGPLVDSKTSLDAKMISSHPLDEDAVWKCEKCTHQIASKQMMDGNNVIKKEIKKMDKCNPKEWEDFLEKYKMTLHPLNTHVLQVKYVLTQLYGNIKGYSLNDLSSFQLSRKIELCQELLDVAAILEPGYSRFRGVLLLDMQSAITVKTKKDFESGHTTKTQIILMESMKCLQEANEILKSEPDMKETLEGRIEELSKLIEEFAE